MEPNTNAAEALSEFARLSGAATAEEAAAGLRALGDMLALRDQHQ